MEAKSGESRIRVAGYPYGVYLPFSRDLFEEDSCSVLQPTLSEELSFHTKDKRASAGGGRGGESGNSDRGQEERGYMIYALFLMPSRRRRVATIALQS